MPMPPMPTKWIGPISRGSFIAEKSSCGDAELLQAVPHPPPAAPDRPAARRRRSSQRPWRRPPSAASGRARAASAAISAASRSGVKSAWSRRIAPPASISTPALARWSWSSACGSGMRMPGRPIADKLGDGRGARARHDEMARRHARRQVLEERRHVAGDLQPRIGVANARQILVAGLLHDLQPRPQPRLELFDRRRHDVRHHAGALAAAEHQKLQRSRRRSSGG